ncbi:MAG: hydrogenase maturation protease [Candidatus Caldarchaeum sp.]
MKKNNPPSRVKVVCIGNRLRGDDAAGRYVADLLRKNGGIDVVEASSPLEILDVITSDTSHLIVVDAVENRGNPGKIHRLEIEDLISKNISYSSTHLLSLPESIKLLTALGEFGGKITLFGVEGADFGYGEKLSPKVEEACRKIANMIKIMFAWKTSSNLKTIRRKQASNRHNP